MSRVQTIYNLYNEFAEELGEPVSLIKHLEDSERWCTEADTVTMGIEIEVRWRSYFPELWGRYLADTRYVDLSQADKDELTLLCNAKEKALLPRLEATERCGIPRGKDRYWEFAFKPVHHWSILFQEVKLLRKLNLIPSNMKHSLHITLGGIKSSRDAYMMLMALEILGYSSHERLVQQANYFKFGWGIKGRAGICVRSPEELDLGKKEGIELRTLELPKDENEISALLWMSWTLAQCLKSNPNYWSFIKKELENIGKIHDLDLKNNWGRPYKNPGVWLDFAEKIPKMDVSRLKQLIIDIPK